MKVGKISLFEVVRCGIVLFFKNLGALLVSLVICLGISVGLMFVLAKFLGRFDIFLQIISGKQIAAAKILFSENIALAFSSIIIFGLLIILLYSGFIKLVLSLCGNKKFHLATLFSTYKYILNLIGLIALITFLFLLFAQMVSVPLIYLIGFLIGQGVLVSQSMLFYIVTYSIVALGVLVANFVEVYFYVALFAIVDKSMSLFQASGFALKLIKGNKIRLVILFFLTSLLSYLDKFVRLIPDLTFVWQASLIFIIISLVAVLKICIYVCMYRKLLVIKGQV